MELNFKENIKRILKEKGIQMQDFAQILDIHPISLSRAINQDYPQLQTVEKYAKVLNVEPSEILFGIKDKPTEPDNHVCPHCGKKINISITLK